MLILGFATMDNEDAATEIEGILKKHGVSVDEEEEEIDLDDEAAMKEAAAQAFKDVKNKPALFQELIKAVEKYADQRNVFLPKNARLKDVKIEGDTATGTVSSDDGENEAAFVKKNGRWYANFD
jgi:hypothetical protein